MSGHTEIVEAPLVSPANLKDVLEASKKFEEFKRQVLTPNDYVILDVGKEKKSYIKKSGWMKYALACQLSLEKRDEQLEEPPSGGKIYHYTYRASAPNGRFADAVGSASTTERQFAHPDHDVRALAQTRACNRAISNLVAGGEVSAEEMISDPIEKGPESPIPKPVSPSQPTEITVGKSEESTLKVPLANDFLPENKPPGLKQFPLIRGLKDYGMLNQADTEISVVPRAPVNPDTGYFHWFMEGSVDKSGIVKPICEKYKLHYEPLLDENKLLKAIIISGGQLDYDHVMELVRGAARAFQILLEEKP